MDQFPSHPNAQPVATVDNQGRALVDTQPNFVGKPRPLGRERLVYALPLSPGPMFIGPATVTVAPASAVASPAPELIGREWVMVSRMATALATEDTRSLGGGGAP